jgi:hypothetical protein
MFAPLVTGGQQPLGNEPEGCHEATAVMFTRNLCARLRTIGDGQQPRTSVAIARASCRADTTAAVADEMWATSAMYSMGSLSQPCSPTTNALTIRRRDPNSDVNIEEGDQITE